MYVITFYSFKGGVGRTFALVNVAAELARMGRKVLLVDFDLGAPGLETFDRLRSPQPHPGVVEYVREYMSSKRSPDVRSYTYSAGTVGQNGGELLVMPAGRRDSKYQAALGSIDWKRLYRDCQGYWFFEDTKQQWEEAFKPDYVLIDSRTGHTDVEGICTRQLPEAVVALFFPNEQNLVGLKDVCRQIRGEKETGLKKEIRVHFVMSNVPDLDDEDRVLRKRLQAFHEELGIGKWDAVIHHYESVLLFNQGVFVLDRPHSRLAREYQRLVRALIEVNLPDRDGALLSLRRYAKRYLPTVDQDIGEMVKQRLGSQESRWYELEDLSSPPREAYDLLDRIEGHFYNDADLLVKIAECRTLKGELKRAVGLLNRALFLQTDHAHALFQRALCKKQLDDKPGAADDLCKLLRIDNLDSQVVLCVLRELRTLAPMRLAEAGNLLASRSLTGDTREVCDLLADSREGMPYAIRLMRQFLADLGPGADPAVLHSYLIRTGQWREVIESVEGKGADRLGPGDLFELAVARWGETGNMPTDVCRLALERNDKGIGRPLVHFHYGAVWLLLWGAGRGSEVLPLVSQAEEEVKEGRRRPFSIWRFREVSPDQFLEDCQQFRRMIQGEPIRPAFLGELAGQGKK